MVTPFQLLLVVGIGQAIVNCVGETLSGAGQIAFRAKVNVVWCAATLVALLVLVTVDGIRGAALAHLIVFVPYAAVYATAGARRAGTTPSELWLAVRPVVMAVGCQAAVTAAVALALRGTGEDLAACAGALAGLLVVAVLLARDNDGPARQLATLLRAARDDGRQRMIARLTAPWPAGAMAPDPRTRLRAAALVGLAVLAAIAFGAALPEDPRAAVALVALVPLALGAPVASLGVLLFLTVVVPFDVQNRLSFVGGENVPGLLIVDLLVFLGLCRVALLVGTKKLRVETPLLVAAALGLVLAGFLVEGVAGGADLSEAGHEARRLGMGVAGFILAWPILGRPASRRAPVRAAPRARADSRSLGTRSVVLRDRLHGRGRRRRSPGRGADVGRPGIAAGRALCVPGRGDARVHGARGEPDPIRGGAHPAGGDPPAQRRSACC